MKFLYFLKPFCCTSNTNDTTDSQFKNHNPNRTGSLDSEVETSEEYTNLALNQQAEQQDDYSESEGNGPASNAVDGNQDGNWG